MYIKQCLMILWVGNTNTFIGLLSVQPTFVIRPGPDLV